MSSSSSVQLNRLLARGKFRHVEVLLKVAELGSVQRAADAIGLTQSSVTQTLAYLEELLDTPLFQRMARGMRPTAACEELLPIARQLMSGLADAAGAVTAHRQRGGSTVRLAASASAINGLLLRRLAAFHERHPDIEVQLRQAEGEDQLLAIGRGEVDLVACRQPAVVPQRWTFEPILQDSFVVVCDPSHPLRRKRRLPFDALTDQTWLAAPSGTAVREKLDSLTAGWPERARLHPLVTRLLRPIESHVVGSQLISLLPRSFVEPLLTAGTLAVLPLGEQMPLAPIGVLAPVVDMRPAAMTLASHLRSARA